MGLQNKRVIASAATVAMMALTALVGCSKGNNGPVASSDLYNSGIIGGQDATGDEDFAKSVVSLYNVTEGSLCTASILSDSILVTAAHCTAGPASSLRVIFGTDLRASSRQIREVAAYETSPLWPARGSETFNTGDVAVVRFSGGLPDGFHPASVLADASALQTGATVMLAGYGISDGVKHTGAGILRYVETTIQDASYSETEVLIDQSQGKGACHGDSGGPAFVKVDGEWKLWGVTNRGVNDPNNDCSVSSAYTSIPYYQSWITKTAKKLMKKAAATNVKIAAGA